jgi:hypothetical protein
VKELDSWVDPRIVAVRVADVRAYLVQHGWRLEPYPRPELLVFKGPPADNGEPIIQVVPSSEQLDEYPQRLVELIGALAAIEDRPAGAVLADLLPSQPDGPGAQPNGQ